MRILVTGASGFLGRRLVPRLRAEGYAPVALLLPAEPALPPLAEAAAIARGDVTEPASLAGVADGCAAVVHLAAAVGYGQRMAPCRRLNRDGTAHVADEAVRAGARRFVQLSSVSVYGRAPGRPLAEDAPLRRTGDPYGDTKIEAEELLTARAARGALELTVLRPTVIHGPGDRRFLPKLVENLRGGRARIVGDGRNTVDAIHVDDVVEAIVRVLAEPRAIGATYNLNHPANPTWNELVAEVARLLGVDAPVRHLPYPLALAAAGALEAVAWLRGAEPRLTRYAVRVVGRQYHYRVERARRELGFEPRIGLLDSVRGALAAPGGSA